MDTLLILAVAFLFGGVLGYGVRFVLSLARQKSIETTAKEAKIAAQDEAQQILREAQKKADIFHTEVKTKENELDIKIKKHEQELSESRSYLREREQKLDDRESTISSELETVKKKIEDVRALHEMAEKKVVEQTEKLSAVARLSEEEAREELLSAIESRYQEDLLVRIRKLEQDNHTTLERKAQGILASVIQRLSTSTASELTTSTISIPNEEMKGKIIGKEGRNIRAFERAAGVELIVDDGPETVVISSYDPIRRQVARVALENLLLDGRIQPAKIEEFVESAQKEISEITREKGEQAVHELGIYNLDPRIVAILGRLYFRSSYGQNVLQHSIEMAYLAGMLAEELGADVAIAKAGALVHDIGKALDHEIQGSHVEIGIKLLRKFGVDERVVTAMKSHHDDYPHESIESIIVQTTDMISGSRPGARRDSLESYIRRLKDLEEVALRFDGIEKAYALSAGREVRVFCEPKKIDDVGARKMARDIAKQIEEELRYPGEIKVMVIRENRIIEYAR